MKKAVCILLLIVMLGIPSLNLAVTIMPQPLEISPMAEFIYIAIGVSCCLKIN